MAVQAVRGSLIRLYNAVQADPAAPQEAARRFGLNKNLTWKISRIMGAEDGLSAIQHMPGPAGMDILLSTFEAKGAPVDSIDAVRQALREFDDVVTAHAGDREHLQLILDSMGLAGSGPRLESSRELAFRGNSGIWGIQARARIVNAMLTPARESPGNLDITMVGGFVGLQRLRPEVTWPLFKFRGYRDDGTHERFEPEWVEPDATGLLPSGMLGRFSTSGAPLIAAVRDGTTIQHILQRGPVGNSGAFDCFFGRISRGVSIYRTEQDRIGELTTAVSLPIQTLIFDVLVHRELQVPMPKVLVFARPPGSADEPKHFVESNLLPLEERCVDLVGSPPVVASVHFPRAEELAQTLYDRLGYPGREFRGLRLLMRHPPMPSTVVIRWDLPEAPHA